jgi:nitroreductase
VPQELQQQVLTAAMYAPSACNQQPWQFVVIEDRPLLREIPKINSYAAMAAEAPGAILVCGDSRLETVPGYWVIDCSAAVQNLLLAATRSAWGPCGPASIRSRNGWKGSAACSVCQRP